MTMEPGQSPLSRPGTVFELVRDPADLPPDLVLRNAEWGLIFTITGEHTAAQVGDHLGLPPAERDAAFDRLRSLGLIRERPVNREEYLRAAATIRDDEPKTLAAFLRSRGPRVPDAEPVVTKQPQPETAPPPPPEPQGPSPEEVLAALSEVTDDRRTRAVPTFDREALLSFQPLAHPTTAAAPTPEPPAPEPSAPEPPAPETPAPEPRPSGAPAPETPAPGVSEGAPDLPASRLSVRALMQYILDRAADLHAGQLDIYRVFIRVNTKLLKRNGIHTLRFEEDRLISDPELQDAIAASMQRTLGLPCPREIFV
ncbi:MAG: hypothetical protein AAGN66_03035 [Acidobacteriota bacterium]